MFEEEDDDDIECWLTILWGYARTSRKNRKPKATSGQLRFSNVGHSKSSPLMHSLLGP